MLVSGRRSPATIAMAGRPFVPQFYSTSFAATENPISEGGKWLGGATDNLDDNNCRSGLADDGTTRLGFGTGSITTAPFIDSIAVLKPSFIPFPADQSVTTTLYRSGSVSGEHECELLLRWLLSAHVAFGYEITVVDGGAAYLVIIGSDFSGNNSGATNPGVFHVILGPINTNMNGATGSVYVAKAVGTVISLTCNGNAVFSHDTASDPFKISTGQPGFGFYADNTLGAQSANNTYGWKTFAAAAE